MYYTNAIMYYFVQFSVGTHELFRVGCASAASTITPCCSEKKTHRCVRGAVCTLLLHTIIIVIVPEWREQRMTNERK